MGVQLLALPGDEERAVRGRAGGPQEDPVGEAVAGVPVRKSRSSQYGATAGWPNTLVGMHWLTSCALIVPVLVTPSTMTPFESTAMFLYVWS